MSIRWIKMIENLAAASQAASEGFAGLQLPLGTLEALTADELHRQKGILEDLGLSLDACSTPLPQGVVVTERGFNIYVWTEYAKRALHKAADLGCRLLIWNDGRARLMPLEGDTSGGRQQVLEFLAMLCDLSAEYGTTVAVEPLGPRRTNYLNRMQDIVELAEVVRRENLSSMISLRELSEIGLTEPELRAYARLIAHVQLENPDADPAARIAPRPGDRHDYSSFISALKGIEYDRSIALPADADTESLKYCEKLWGSSS